MEEYSVQNPETSSLSASGISNGVRLISASPVMMNRQKARGWVKTYQFGTKGMTPPEIRLLQRHDLAQAQTFRKA